MSKYSLAATGAVLGLLLAACQSASPPQSVDLQQPAVEPIAPKEQMTVTQEAEALTAPAIDQGAEAPTAPVVESETEDSPTPVVVRQGLAATNPASVDLANGTPTFVEFFAYW